MPAPQHAIDAREQALAKLLEAKEISQAHPGEDLTGQDGRRFDQAMAEYKRLYGRYLALVEPDERRRLAAQQAAEDMSILQAIEHFTGKPTGPVDLAGRPLPFGGRGSAGGSRPGLEALGPSWADQVPRFAAGLVDPSGGAIVSVPVSPNVIGDPRRARFVSELVPAEAAPGGIYKYLKQTVRTFNAAAVAKLDRKPTSAITVKAVEDRTRTIATLSEPVARQDLADATALRDFVDGELRLALFLELDREMIASAGAGEELTGFLSSGIGTQADVGGGYATTRRAVTKLRKLEVVPTAWVMNPTDWETIEMEAVQLFSASVGINAPAELADERLHSLPVFQTNAIAAGTALLGDFAGSAQLYTTGQVTVDWSEAVFDPDFDGGDGATDFERNALRFRAEGRWGLAVLRPSAFVAVEIETIGSGS